MPFTLDTENWSDDGQSTITLDDSSPLKKIMIELDLVYTDSGSLVLERDQYAPDGCINYISVRDSSHEIQKIYGADIHHIYALMSQSEHGMTVLGVGAGAGKTAEAKFDIPLEIPVGRFKNPTIEINWQPAAGIHADYVIQSASINGTYMHTVGAVEPFKIIPNIEKNNKTGEQTIFIPAEGMRLTQALIIARAHASPAALRHALSKVWSSIDGVLEVWDGDNAATEYKHASKLSEVDGVYLLRFPKKPKVTNNASKITLEGDGTATDWRVYWFFVEPSSTAPLEDKPTGVSQTGTGGRTQRPLKPGLFAGTRRAFRRMMPKRRR